MHRVTACRVTKLRRLTRPTAPGLFLTDPAEIHLARAPVGGINTDLDITVKTAVLPLPGSCYAPVFNGIVMDVIRVPDEIHFIAQGMFPEPVLPYGLLPFLLAGCIRRRSQIFPAMFCKPGFDKPPAQGKITIVGRQAQMQCR
uniref:Uncharacterized protein n=1 Tax=Candidatus Kentrum sp. LPFa TaxID=2126335 RepID=A0A450WC99_9GAMM|nr:MAG: hypothetical protein BECKLPF1236A_GA0070988_1011112 [Candidatus Kentron sp. LPFa]VFK31089.1 MAG: hypothetical protein BECKLPF1236C_GA0070990_1012712 [Candidatus Kentron sp. LPFa]